MSRTTDLERDIEALGLDLSASVDVMPGTGSRQYVRDEVSKSPRYEYRHTYT